MYKLQIIIKNMSDPSLNLRVGHVVKLKNLYAETDPVGIIIEIHRSEFPGDGGWISMDYTVMMSSGKIIHLTESCIEKVIR